MNTRILVGCALILVLGAASVWYYMRSDGGYDHQFVDGEAVSAWDFQGAYEGNAELEQKARDEIERLRERIGSGEDTDYSYYISIAGQYDYLGDGKKEYDYLRKALKIDAETTGLAWYNLGSLMHRLGAQKTALDAFSRAMRAQPIPQYVTAYLEYITRSFPHDNAAIEEAFAEAVQVSGADSSAYWEIRARWLEETGKIQEAINVWKKVKELSPAATSIIDAEIARLEAQL